MMTATASATATRTMFAVDLEKYTSMACRFEPDTGAFQFRSVTTGCGDFRVPIERHGPA